MKVRYWLLAALGSALLASQALAQSGPVADAKPAADADPANAPICTDRPTKANGPCTVPAGHWQVETDIVNWTYASQNGVRSDLVLSPNPTLKRGLTDHLDVEVNWAPYQMLRTRSAAGDTRASGIGDVYLRLKWALYSGAAVSVSVTPWVKAPTASRALGNGRVEEGVAAPININLPDKFALTFGPELDALENASLHGQHASLVNLVGLSRPVTDKLTLFGEVWNDQNFDPTGTTSQSSADVAAAYLLSNTLQFDLGANFGLNRATPRAQAYVGVSKRF